MRGKKYMVKHSSQACPIIPVFGYFSHLFNIISCHPPTNATSFEPQKESKRRVSVLKIESHMYANIGFHFKNVMMRPLNLILFALSLENTK